jgi:hypothetical protein
MRTIPTLALVLSSLSSLSSLPLQAGEPPPNADAGFVPLFDGRTFDGWKINDATPQSWKIDGGMLQLTGGRSHLFTTKAYEDFVVRFEWRPARKGYNSGFFVRGNQIQMAQGGAGMLFHNAATKAVPNLHKPPGEWNEWEVTCIGTKLALKVNGTTAWEIDNFAAKKAPLGIEAEGHAIDFRNLRVKEIKTRDKPQ